MRWLVLGIVGSFACGGKRVDLVETGRSTGGIAVSSETVKDGPWRLRSAPRDTADLAVLYGGEQRGRLGTCGCPKNPRGSLARAEVHAERVRRHVPTLLVNAGGFLDDTIGVEDRLRGDVLLADRFMVEGLRTGRWSAWNISYHEIPFFEEEGAWPEEAVSANLVPLGEGRGPAPYRIVSTGGLQIGVTGVTKPGMSFLVPSTVSIADPVASARDVVAELAPQVDLVVLLAYETGRQTQDLLAIDGVDLLIEADRFQQRWSPEVIDDTVWVRSYDQMMQLGELRIDVDDGAIRAVRDRKIELDDSFPDAPRLGRLVRESERMLEAARRQVFAP